MFAKGVETNCKQFLRIVCMYQQANDLYERNNNTNEQKKNVKKKQKNRRKKNAV